MAELDYQYLYTLIKHTMEGDSDSFADLYAATYENQYRFACYFTGDLYLAQDVLKLLYIYALKHIKQLTDTEQLLPWLDQINFRLCCQMLPEAFLAQVPEAVQKLPFPEARVVLMYDYRSLTRSEMSLATGESVQSLMKLYRHARKLLDQKHVPVAGHGSKAKDGRQRAADDPALEAKLDYKGADILLSTVLDACNYKPHTIPVSKLSTNRIFRKDTYVLPKVIIGIILAGLLLLPLLFVTPAATISSGTNKNNGSTEYYITVSSLLRVKSVVAVLDAKKIPVYETAKKVYTIEPKASGSIRITITLENGQYSTNVIAVN